MPFHCKYYLLLLTTTLFSGSCFAEPTGGEITSGTGQIQALDANTTLVTQETNTLSINWQSLNLSSDELLRFEQPSSQSSALNTILDQHPTEILGRIDANGRVFLMNPNGIIFGESSRINVGAFAAGAFQINENSFNENGEFTFNTGAGLVENFGKISAEEGGSVALIGQTVSNHGEINAQLGKIHLLSADTATLSFDANGLIQFSVSKKMLANNLGSDSAIYNDGVLKAGGGYVVLEAHAARNIYNNVVNNEGLIEANSISNEGGVIRLEGVGGNVVNSGDLYATGLGEGETGGEIMVFGDRVGVFGNANIDVSGNAGGGDIAIGGYRKGLGSNISEFTQVSGDTNLRADAISQGQGGEIVIWADDTTWATGTVSATGGSLTGDGGFVEISGKKGLVLSADVDLTATKGLYGTLLLDPTDIVIHDQADGVQGDDGFLPDLSDATRGAGSFDIGELALEALATNSNLILEATNDITINDLADNTLGFIINAGGSIVMTADAGTADGVGSFIMNTGDTLSTQGGSLTISGAGVTLGTLNTGAGAITINSSASVNMGAATSASQAVNVSVDNDNNSAEILTLRGALSGSTVTLQGGTDGNDTLIAPDSVNTWAITSLNAGTVNGYNFSNFPNLSGGSLADSFSITGIGSVTGQFDGGGGTDSVDYSGTASIISLALNSDVISIEDIIGNGAASSLVADNVANTWVITSENDGTVDGVSFTDFSNLTGGTSTDDFTLNGGSVTGTLNGGSGINSLTANDAPNNWNILSANGGNIVGDIFSFANIENITGGSFADTFILNSGTISGTIDGDSGSDSLAADNVANTWNVTAINAGDVTGVGAFVKIENLNGRNDTDDYVIDDGFSVSGTIDGGSGQDSVDLSAQTAAVIVDLGGSSYANIEKLTGNSSNSTLVAANTPNVWVIDGSGDGVDDGTVGGVSFVNFNNLTGGSDTDSFSLSSGTLSGAIVGGAGDDTLIGDNVANTWNISVPDAGIATGAGSFIGIENLTGNASTDDFIFADASSITGVINGTTGVDSVDYSAETGTVVVTMGFTGFLNIESFVGNNTDSTIIGNNVANDWVINGINDGSVTYLSGSTTFTNFNNLTGGSNTDRFSLSGGSISGQLDGGVGSNTLVGDNQANTWTLTGADSGTVSGVLGFSNIANLTGNLDADEFVFTDPGSLTGVISGSSGIDTVNFSAKTSPVSVDLADPSFANIETFVGNSVDSTLLSQNIANTWSISSVNDGSVGIISFIDFNKLVGNDNTDDFQLSAGGSITGSISGGLGVDSIQGKNAISTWNITGANLGDLSSGIASFSEIETLQAGTLNDTFSFSDGASFVGVIDGGSGIDELNKSLETGSVNVDLSTPSFVSIESFVGNGSNSALVGADVNSTWIVTGTDSGSVNGIGFFNFNNITGNTQDDLFQINGGSVTGTLSGGGGDDTLIADNTVNTWNILATDSGNVNNVANYNQIENIFGGDLLDAFVFDDGATMSGNVDGGIGSDSVDFSAESGAVLIDLGMSSFSNVELFIGNNSDSTIIGPVSSNSWVVTGNNDGTVGTVAFNNFTNLVGNVTSDYFQFQNGSAVTGSVDGGNGLDTADFTLESGIVNVGIGGTGYTQIETFIGNGSSSTLIGDNIANTWVITGVNDGTVGAITFTDFNNLTGNNNTDDFTLNSGSITGSIDGGTGINSITADNVSNTWSILSADTGNVTGISAFSNIQQLNGNSNADNFIFSDGSSISGIIDAGGGVDIIDQSAQSGFVNLTLGSTGFDNVESIIGNGANSTLTGENIINAWTIIGPDTGTVGPIVFSNISNLQGGNNIDTFTINGGVVTGQIDGGNGNDLILAENIVNTWNITGADTGNVNGVGSFLGIEILQGNADADSFIFADGSSYSGIINGAGGSDVVDFSSETGVVTTSLATSQFQSIESFIGNGSDSTLIGDNIINNWAVTGSNSGSVNSITFSGFNNLQGNSSVDNFSFSGGSITGMIDGSTGNDSIQAENLTNTWSITSNDAGSLTNVNAFQNIDNLLGGSAVDTFNINANLSGMVDGGGGDDVFNLGGLVSIVGGLAGGIGLDSVNGPAQNSNWIISGSDSGFVNGISFLEVESLNGGIEDDSFNISNAATTSLSGNISGGAGNDDLFIDYVALSSRTINYDGGIGIDSISVTGSGVGLVNNYIFGPASDAVSIASTSGVNSQNVVGAGIEIITDTMTADSIVLLGTSGDDAIQISPGIISGSQPVSFQISGIPALQFSNKANLDIDASIGTDSVTVNGVVDLAGDITIAAESINQGSGGQLGADILTFSQAGNIGSSINPLVTSANTLAINGTTIDAYINEVNGVAISAANISGILSVSSNSGDITSAGSLNVIGTSSFDVANGSSIVLDNAANQFSGTPSFSSAGTINNIVLTNNSAIDLPALNLSGDLTIISTGAVTQVGALSIQGNTSVDSNIYSILLTNVANDFVGRVSLQNSGSANTAITDSNSLTLDNLIVGSGTLTITAGSISQIGPLVQSSNAGSAILTATTGDISLTNGANDFTGTVLINNTGGANNALSDSTDLTLGSSFTSGGDLTVVANNGIDLTGTSTSSGGDISITANLGDIQLGHVNSGTGRLTINAVTGNVIGDNSTITNPNLSSQTLEIFTGGTIGDFNNPISLRVPSTGTSYFLTGEGSANIIGLTGTVLPGSVLVNNVTNSNIAVGIGKSVSFIENTLSPAQAFFPPLFNIAGGGVHLYRYDFSSEPSEDGITPGRTDR